MKSFVTGASGFIGNELTKALLERGDEVSVVVRSPEKLNLEHPRLSVFEGDLHSLETIERAMKNSDAVFHLAAYANIWSRDKLLAYRTNVIGTKNILNAALKNKVKKLVFTSSAATMPPSKKGELVDENFPVPDEYGTEYETTKLAAEKLCLEYVGKGLDVVIVNPTRLYGPGFLNKSNSVTVMIKKYIEGSWRFVPGDGRAIGNYVFVDDVVEGHLLALYKGRPGQRYILGGENASFNDFFEQLAKASGQKRTLFHIPLWLMMAVARFEYFMAETFKKPPLITPPWVRRYNEHRPLSSLKAKSELGFSPRSLSKGFEQTIDWIKLQYHGNES